MQSIFIKNRRNHTNLTTTWEQRKLGECFDERTERSADGELIAVTINSGVVKASELNRHDNSSEDKSNYKVVRVNDIAYNSMRMWQGASGYSQYDGILSPAYTVVIPRENVNPVFFSYMFKRTDMIHEFQINSQGLTSDTWNLKFPAFSTISANVPKSEEQQAIGNYFTNLDNLITLHQRKYSLLFIRTFEILKEACFFLNVNAWEQRKLGDVASNFEYGLNASAKEFDGENKYIRITDIDDESRVFLSDDITSPDTDLISADKYKLEKGDILFARTGASVGKTYLYREKDGLVYYAGFLIRAKINPENDAEFVFQNTLTDSYDSFIRITSQRSGQPGVNAQEYQGFSFYVPSLKEQQLIGTYFKNLDSLITLHQRSYNLEQKSKTTNAWEQRKLSDIVERVTRKNENLESELPLTISAQYGLIDQNEFFDKRIASRDVSGYYLLKKGEFAYNKSTSSDAPWGAVKRLDRYEMGVLSTLYIVFALKEDGNIDSDFLVSYYDTDCWHKGVQAIAAEGARNHGLLNITPADYFETVLTVPSDVKEQHQIGTFFARLDNLITLHQRNSYGLHLPQGLYPSAIAWS